MTEQLVSAVENVPAPDGTTFDILRWAPENAAKIRGQALVDMRKIAEEREPDLTGNLRTGPGLSAEYAMSSAISHAKDKGVKADLTRVLVGSNLAEGHRSSAVSTLAYARAAELDLPEYSEETISGWYDEAMSEGDSSDAWFVATRMLREGGKIVKAEEGESAIDQESWEGREKEAFTRHANEVLEREAKSEETGHNWELQMLFDECRFREDGYQAEKPSDLSRKVAEAVISRHLRTPGREWVALIDATEAKMPDDYVAQLRRQVKPNAIDRAKKWWEGVRAKASKVAAK